MGVEGHIVNVNEATRGLHCFDEASCYVNHDPEMPLWALRIFWLTQTAFGRRGLYSHASRKLALVDIPYDSCITLFTKLLPALSCFGRNIRHSLARCIIGGRRTQSYTHEVLGSVTIRNQLKFRMSSKYSRNWQTVSA